MKMMMKAEANSGPHAPGSKEEQFTDKDLQAAVNLVLLSESSSASLESKRVGDAGSCSSDGASSSWASVNTAHPGAFAGAGDAAYHEAASYPGARTGYDSDPMVDEESTGPWARPRRYRSVKGLYLVTPRVEGTVGKRAAGQRRKKAVREAKADVKAKATRITASSMEPAVKRKSRV